MAEKKIKTSKLEGTALDWAVAQCEQITVSICQSCDGSQYLWVSFEDRVPAAKHRYDPSSDWAQAGPIIERERISIAKDGSRWLAMTQSNGVMQWGDSYLQAAMRCYVASKRGDEVEIPEELTHG